MFARILLANNWLMRRWQHNMNNVSHMNALWQIEKKLGWNLVEMR
jgi:hypothetical protein